MSSLISSASSNLSSQLTSNNFASFFGSTTEANNLNIRDKQKDALKVMLNLNAPIQSSVAPEPVWKLFIYDRHGQGIVSPLITVKELRDLGVTLHMQLHSDRDAIPDVPAVYFVMPTDENIMRICQDFRNHLYDFYYLNFIAPISRTKLEELATVALQTNCSASISKVYDQYLNFVSLEDDVFTLKHTDHDAISYYSINRPVLQETEIENIMDYIVNSLFSVFVTLGVVPIIRAPKGNAAEMVAEKLDKKIRENLRDSRNTFFNQSTSLPMMFSRPLLVILDRSIDMATPLVHSWTYQALAHDVLDLKLNQVYIDASSANDSNANKESKPKKTVYDLNSQDKFWNEQKGSPFPIVAEAIQDRLEKYRSSEEDVKRLKAEMGLDGNIPDQAISLLSDNTSKLTNAVNTLPELLEIKRSIDLHTTVASAILEHIKSRKLDVFFEIEEKIITSRGHLDQKSANIPLDLIKDPASGTPEDKVRLFLVYFLFHDMTESEFERYTSELKAAGCDLSPVNYIRIFKQFSNNSVTGAVKTDNMLSKLMSQGSQFVVDEVKNLMVKKHSLLITRIMDALMEAKPTPETDQFRYFDPKILAKTQSMCGTDGTPTRSSFKDAIVFMVGGGNYIEYQNLLDYCKTKSRSSKRIIYGTTELMNATQYLSQLSKLANEMC